MTNPKLVVMVGYPRSGTTIVGNILNEMEAYFHIGESHYVWERNLLLRRRRCGCGQSMSDCEVWGAILPDVLKEKRTEEALRLQRVSGRSWKRRRLLRSKSGNRKYPEPVEQYLRLLGDFYRRVADETDSAVIVDSSKALSSAVLACLLPEFETHLIQIVRDPRGVILSRQRKIMRKTPGKSTVRLNKIRAVQDCLSWSRTNLIAERILASVPAGAAKFLRYEDFVLEPQRVLAGIIEGLRVGSPGALPFTGERAVVLRGNHTLGGNRNRFTTGQTNIVEDARWTSSLSGSDIRLIELLTRRTFRRYGYRHHGEAIWTG